MLVIFSYYVEPLTVHYQTPHFPQPLMEWIEWMGNMALTYGLHCTLPIKHF